MITFTRRLLCSHKWFCMVILTLQSSLFFLNSLSAQTLTMVELNCENLFDYLDDEGKDDSEYLPESTL